MEWRSAAALYELKKDKRQSQSLADDFSSFIPFSFFGKKKHTQKKTLKHVIREFSCGWIDTNMGTMHKKYSLTNGREKQDNTKCWIVSGALHLLAEKQLSDNLLPADGT